MDVKIQFIDAIRRSGLIPPNNIIDDGSIHRFSSNGKSHDMSGWYIFHDDVAVPVGIFGDWRTGVSQSWRANSWQQLSPTEFSAHKARIKHMTDIRDAAHIQATAEASRKANVIWDQSKDVQSHNYLTKKCIKALGIKQLGNALVIPLLNAAMEIQSLQFINPDGSKRFLKDGRTKGCYFSFGVPQDVIYICEGYATGSSVYEATGGAVVVAFNAGNLKSVAESLRDRFPTIKIVICADDDSNGVGLEKANEAAQHVGAHVVIPNFGDNRPEKVTDFNDLHQLKGLGGVRQQLIANKDMAVLPNCSGSGMNMPEPLPSLPCVLPFDYNYLPDGLRGFVQDISDRMQCPPDFAAVGVMVMMSSIIGRKVGIRPMKHNDWTVIPNLWGAVVGNSGVMKSPTLSAALSPIKKLQSAAYEEFNKAVAETDAQAEIARMQQSINKSEARKLLAKDSAADVSNLLQSDVIDTSPTLKRYITNNASYEALGELLIENPNGMMIEADEIIGLLKQLDASGQEVARSFYLTAADGDKPYTFDRIMRGKGLHVPALCISIIGGIQPGVLAEYVRQATSGGAGADGLLQRFALMVYPDIPSNWREVDRYPDSNAKQSVNQLAEWLDTISPLTDIKSESDDYSNVPYMRFDDDAQTLFSEWREGLEVSLRSGEEHPAIVSHLSKYRKLIPSLALINHLCEYGNGDVTEKSLLRAIAYGEYLQSHARRIYSTATRPDIDAAKTLLNRLSKGKLSSPFKARDVYIKGWVGLDTTQKVQSAVDLLIEYGHLIAKEVVTGGRPTTLYHLVQALK